jgi:hypothetical protein
MVATPPGFKARFEALHYRTIQEQERAKFGAARSVEELRAEAEEQRRLAGQHSHTRHWLPNSHGFRGGVPVGRLLLEISRHGDLQRDRAFLQAYVSKYKW